MLEEEDSKRTFQNEGLSFIKVRMYCNTKVVGYVSKFSFYTKVVYVGAVKTHISLITTSVFMFIYVLIFLTYVILLGTVFFVKKCVSQTSHNLNFLR